MKELNSSNQKTEQIGAFCLFWILEGLVGRKCSCSVEIMSAELASDVTQLFFFILIFFSCMQFMYIYSQNTDSHTWPVTAVTSSLIEQQTEFLVFLVFCEEVRPTEITVTKLCCWYWDWLVVNNIIFQVKLCLYRHIYSNKSKRLNLSSSTMIFTQQLIQSKSHESFINNH